MKSLGKKPDGMRLERMKASPLWADRLRPFTDAAVKAIGATGDLAASALRRINAGDQGLGLSSNRCAASSAANPSASTGRE